MKSFKERRKTSMNETFKGFHLDIEEKMNDSCDMAINALEKQEKIKEAFEKWKTDYGLMMKLQGL